jgi:hypothetical protein
MSYLRAASGSLLPSLALHVGFNTSAVLIWVSGLVGVTESVELPISVVVSSTGLTGFLMFAVHRISCHSELALHARQEDFE